jgi:hypothetical protein
VYRCRTRAGSLRFCISCCRCWSRCAICLRLLSWLFCRLRLRCSVVFTRCLRCLRGCLCWGRCCIHRFFLCCWSWACRLYSRACLNIRRRLASRLVISGWLYALRNNCLGAAGSSICSSALVSIRIGPITTTAVTRSVVRLVRLLLWLLVTIVLQFWYCLVAIYFCGWSCLLTRRCLICSCFSLLWSRATVALV